MNRQYLTLNEAYAAAFAIALDRIGNATQFEDIGLNMDIGDGGSVTLFNKKSPHRRVVVSIGGTLTDMDYPYYEIAGVRTEHI